MTFRTSADGSKVLSAPPEGASHTFTSPTPSPAALAAVGEFEKEMPDASIVFGKKALVYTKEARDALLAALARVEAQAREEGYRAGKFETLDECQRLAKFNTPPTGGRE